MATTGDSFRTNPDPLQVAAVRAAADGDDVADAEVDDSGLVSHPQRVRLRPDAAAWFVRLAWLWVVTVRVLFSITFPLNNFGGDTSNYYAMLRDGTSSLVHAAGYPFLVGLPFRTALVQRLFADALDVQSYVILAAQHLIDLAALLVLFKVVSAVYGRTTAALALLLAGTSLQNLGTTSSAYPEWLQAALLVFALAAAYRAYTRSVFATKICLYMLAAWLFTFCVLVKFNAAVLAFAFIAIVALEPLSLARRALTVMACSVVLGGTAGLYVLLHHEPKTGTFALTYDKSWVLMTKVQMVFANQLDASNGLDTRRWLALSSVLPRSYEQAGPHMYSHVDAIGEDVRGPYRQRFAHLLTADESVVSQVLSSSSLPDGFSVGLSPIPIGYYIGLPESEHLGVRVAMEAVRAKPWTYLASVRRLLWDAAAAWPDDAPFPRSVEDLDLNGVRLGEPLGFGFVRIGQRPDYPAVPYSYSVPVLWMPGVALVSRLDALTPSGSLLLALAVAAVLAALMRVIGRRRLDERSVSTLLLAAIVLVILVVSTATLTFRWKEARLVSPLVAVLAASAVVSAATLAGAWWARRGRPAG